MKKLIITGISAGIFILIITFVGMWMSYQNSEVKLVNRYEAQLKKIEAVHDNMWKVLQQKAGVTKEYSAQFDSIYTHVMDKRYSNSDGVLFNWIKESNPNFSQDLYKELSISIEAQRKQFLDSQEEIVDIVREHNNLLDMVPSSWFVGGRKRLDYEIISSSYSKEVMITKQDNDIELFK